MINTHHRMNTIVIIEHKTNYMYWNYAYLHIYCIKLSTLLKFKYTICLYIINVLLKIASIYMYISIYTSLSLYPIILICFIQTVSHSEVFLSLQFEDHLRLSSLWVGSYILFLAKNMPSMQIWGSVFQEVTLVVVSSKWLAGQQMALVTQTL